MSAGSDIAAEIRAALIEAAVATGEGTLTATLIKPGTTDDTTYPVTYGEPTEHVLTVVLSGYSASDRDGGNVQMGDVRVLAEAADVAPATGDSLLVAGKAFSIVSVTTVQPGGVALMHDIQARAA